MPTTRFIAVLSGIALLSAACGEDRSPSGPDLSLNETTAASSASSVRGSGQVLAKVEETPVPVSAEEACPAGLEAETVGGVTACTLQTDFDVERCVTPEMLIGKSELVLKMGFVNESDLPLYNKPGFFHKRIADCGAIQKNFGVATQAVAGFPVAPQSAGIATWTFSLPPDLCGSYAFVDTVRNGESILFDPMHYVINTGVDCDETCPSPKITFSKSGTSFSTFTSLPPGCIG